MSPEQASADTELDGRSHIYSLACVLHEMLCGQPPFVEPRPQKVMARHATETVPPIRALRANVPHAIGDILAQALAKNAVYRFAAGGWCT